MDTKIFFQHYDLAKNGYVKGLKCIDDDHDILHPFVDNETLKIYYECLLCNFKIKPGMATYNAMLKEINKIQEDMYRDEP